MTTYGYPHVDTPPNMTSLQNMSARPRTEVMRRVPSLFESWVVFSDATVDRALRGPERAAAEAYWSTLSLTGAVLLHAHTQDLALLTKPKPCKNTLLEYNVVLRARGLLLLAESPMMEELYHPQGNLFLCADPRIVRLAL